MNHPSNDIKQLAAQMCLYIAKALTDKQLPHPIIKSLVPMLVNGTKEKNTAVRANSEQALVALLRLRQEDSTYQVRTFLIDRFTLIYKYGFLSSDCLVPYSLISNLATFYKACLKLP